MGYRCTLLCTYSIITNLKMNSKTTLSISEARKKIFQIADDVAKASIHYILTENGKPKIVIMSAEEFESWVETLEVIKDFPDLDKDIKESDKDVKTGKYKKYATLEEILKKEGYEISNKIETAGRKRPRKHS